MKKPPASDVSMMKEFNQIGTQRTKGSEQGADAELETVMERYEGPLLRYAARILNNPTAAQDVVQNVFIKFVRRRRSDPTRTAAEVKAWLYRVTHNAAVDAIRRESRLRVLHEKQAGDPSLEDDHGPTGLTNEEKHEAVLGVLRRLHPREQQVVLLRLEEGLSYREISRITGRSEGNVGNILHHAVRKLTDLLYEDGWLD